MKKGFLIVTTFCTVMGNCILPSPLTLQLILEFAKWRSWDQLVLFENLTSLGELKSIFTPRVSVFSCFHFLIKLSDMIPRAKSATSILLKIIFNLFFFFLSQLFDYTKFADHRWPSRHSTCQLSNSITRSSGSDTENNVLRCVCMETFAEFKRVTLP